MIDGHIRNKASEHFPFFYPPSIEWNFNFLIFDIDFSLAYLGEAILYLPHEAMTKEPRMHRTGWDGMGFISWWFDGFGMDDIMDWNGMGLVGIYGLTWVGFQLHIQIQIRIPRFISIQFISPLLLSEISIVWKCLHITSQLPRVGVDLLEYEVNVPFRKGKGLRGWVTFDSSLQY